MSDEHDQAGADDAASRTQSFIVKTWIEATSPPPGRVSVWRGHITHVPSGERRYVKDLDEISVFIARYLDGVHIRLSLCRQIERRVAGWLDRRSR
jgi:hypothetical protein